MSLRRSLTRPLVLSAAALFALAPLSCKQKEAPEIPVVDDEAGATQPEAEESAPVVAEAEPLPSVHVRASVRELDDVFAWVKQSTGAWTGEPFDISAQAQGMLLQLAYGPGMWTSLNWSGLMAIDFQVPLTEESLPSDFRAYGTLAAANSRAVIDAVPEGRRPQPLGNGVWEMVDENIRLLFREQPTALEFAFVAADLDKATSLKSAVTGPRRLQVVADGIPKGWLDARDFVDVPPDGQAMRQIAAVGDGLSEVRFELDAGTDRDLQLRVGALAPFEKLGLDPLGPPRVKPTALEGRMPGNPVAALSMPWGSPALLHASIDRSVPMDQIPEPFNKLARQAIGASHELLDQVQNDVSMGLYVTKSGRVALLIAADVKDEAAGGQALKQISDAVVQALESYRELAGGSAEVAFKVTTKAGGARLGRGKGDLLRIGVPKNMAGEADRVASFLTKKKEVEIITGVSDGVAMLALGGGAGELWGDAKAGVLASDGGLLQARRAADGCQLCITVDPVGVTRMVATIARDRSTDAKVSKEYAKVLSELGKLGELGDVGLGLQLQAGRGAFAIGFPRALLTPEPTTAKKARELMDRVWDAYFDGEPSEREAWAEKKG